MRVCRRLQCVLPAHPFARIQLRRLAAVSWLDRLELTACLAGWPITQDRRIKLSLAAE